MPDKAQLPTDNLSEQVGIIFRSKAQTLNYLLGRLKFGSVLPLVIFQVRDWLHDSDGVVKRIYAQLGQDKPFAVRSSYSLEDNLESSLAGHFTSVLNANGSQGLSKAIEQVIAAYPAGSENEEVLVQPMLPNVAISGVAFSVDPNTGSPYYVINYDVSTGDTTTVTQGHSGTLKTFYCYASVASEVRGELAGVLGLINELVAISDRQNLDIEFAIDKAGTVWLLQVRPLVVTEGALAQIQGTAEQALKNQLKEIEQRINLLSGPHPYLYGSRTVFGVMPDWNPAEMIGIRPKPLALSLYKDLITDSIWAYQRDNYGYRNLRSFPLLVSFSGQPYIDVRVSFNSFIPQDIQPELGEQLVNYYIDRLIAQPSDHDKVEFNVVYTCYTFDLPERIETLSQFGFGEQDRHSLSESLRLLTNRIINKETGLWKKDLQKIGRLEERVAVLEQSKLDELAKIYWLLEDCKRYGTLPFAGLARAGFIAVQLLKSLVTVGVLNEREYDSFLSSLETVGSLMGHDLNTLDRSQFLAKYGHLRPGTYDILSARYDEDPDKYFSCLGELRELDPAPKTKKDNFSLSLSQLKQTEKLLQEHKLEHDVIGFFDFIRIAIEGREHAKFVFSKSLSDSLKLLSNWGSRLGISVEDLSYLNSKTVSQLYASAGNCKSEMMASIEQGKREYAATCQIALPPLIVNSSDVWAFEMPETEPNFITQKTITGPVKFSLDGKDSLRDAIVLIPSADPGYDWIFAHGIKGLVTMYGGMNSHMAIRAGEMGIAAVIGAGESLFKRWSSAKYLQIDCAGRQVKMLGDLETA